MRHIKSRLSKLDRLMTAITFAEAGERETALEFLYQKTRKNNSKRKTPKIRKWEQKHSNLRT